MPILIHNDPPQPSIEKFIVMNKGLDNGQDLPQELLMVWDNDNYLIIIFTDCTIRITMTASSVIHCLVLKMGVI